MILAHGGIVWVGRDSTSDHEAEDLKTEYEVCKLNQLQSESNSSDPEADLGTY